MKDKLIAMLFKKRYITIKRDILEEIKNELKNEYGLINVRDYIIIKERDENLVTISF